MNKNFIKNILKRNKLFLLSSFLISTIGTTSSNATNRVSTYYLGGSEAQLTGFIDEELPPAIKANVALDSSIPAGTILYRYQHLNVTYYSPVPHPVIKGTQYENSNKAFREWGPWDMDENRTAYNEGSGYKDHFIPSSYKYEYVTLKKGAEIEVPYVGSGGKDISGIYGTVSEDTRVRVKSITNYSKTSGLCVYFSIDDVPITRSSTFTPAVRIGRVSMSTSNIGIKEGYKKIYNTTENEANKNVYDNFSLYGHYEDTTDSSHQNVSPGKWKNPSYADYGMANLSGEWKCLGFNSKGEPLYNPYFASKSLMYRGNAPLAQYDFRYTPWDKTDSYSGDAEYDKEDAYEIFPERTVYDIDANGKYRQDKRNLIRRLYETNKLTRKSSDIEDDITYMMNRISFITHPSRESAVMMVQRKSGVATRKFMVENDINDIYLHSIIVKDENGNKIGSYSYDIYTDGHTSKSAWVKAGQKYYVEIYLANANNNTLVSTKTQAQIGLIDNHATVLTMPYGSTYGNQSNEVNKKIGSYKTSKSDPISFTITAPTENVDFFDVYGYVGYKHSGTDNMNFKNDVGYVRLNINGTNYEEETEYKYGDLVAKKIELIDSNGNIAYSYTRDDNAPTVNKILPLTSYTVKFTTVNEGDTVQYRTKSRGQWDSSGLNWIPGTWGEWTKLKTNIVNAFEYTRIGSAVSNDTVNLLPRETFTTSNIGVVLNDGYINAGQEFSYIINNVFIEDPYFKCGFTVSSSKYGNSDTSNDALDIEIKPSIDAIISNVKVNSTTEYIGDDSTNVSYIVSYDVKLDAPEHMEGKLYLPVDTSIKVGTKTEIKRDLLSVGENKNLSHVITDVPISSAGSITATVITNYNKYSYETNYNNNTGISSTNIVKIGNPFNTTICSVANTKNSWAPTQPEYKWTATAGGYSTATGQYRRYKKYSVNSSTVNPSYSESYEISKIEFRSKYTKDKNLGSNKDGWIDMTKTSQSDNAYISAGYGFELRITTTFKTNANYVGKASYMATNALSGTNYSYITAKDNHNLSKELFVELPGSKTTKKILSTTGYSGTTKGLKVSQSSDKIVNNQRVITNVYTLNSVNSLGVSNSDKIFVPTTMKDGEYKISIYTPLITGTPTASVSEQLVSKMCDRTEITVKVKGSYTDDLNSHSVNSK